MDQLRVGSAEIDITPALGTVIGVDMLPGFVKDIHDPLYAKCLVVENARERLAIIVVDVCIMHTDYMDSIKQKINEATGIEPTSILLAANHNHASGDVVGLLGGFADLAYYKSLAHSICTVVIQATKNLQVCKVGYMSTPIPEYVVCRRYIMQEGFEAPNPVTGKMDQVKTNAGEHNKSKILGRASIPDTELCALAFKNEEGQIIGILANYGLHYAADWPVDTITADYFGAFAKHVNNILGYKTVSLMSNGASGDVNIWDFLEPDRLPKGDFEKSDLIGKELATKAIEGLSQSSFIKNTILESRFEIIKLGLRSILPEDLKRAKEAYLSEEFSDLGSKEDFVQRIYNREQVLLEEYAEIQEMYLQVFNIVGIKIAALPGEFFAETGLKLKAEMKNAYFSINLCNSYGGYIPPKHEFEKGGYETWRARSSFLEEDAEEKIRIRIAEMLKTL
jgi:neutral ceramidase